MGSDRPVCLVLASRPFRAGYRVEVPQFKEDECWRLERANRPDAVTFLAIQPHWNPPKQIPCRIGKVEDLLFAIALRVREWEVVAFCILHAICDVIVGNVDGARSPDDPDMTVMVGAATTRAQAKQPLQVPDIDGHGGVGPESFIKLQSEDPRIQRLVDAGKILQRRGKVVSSEKARGIVYRRYEDHGRNVSLKQVVLIKLLPGYVVSVAHDSLTGADHGIRKMKDKVLGNFYWLGIDGDMTRY